MLARFYLFIDVFERSLSIGGQVEEIVQRNPLDSPVVTAWLQRR